MRASHLLSVAVGALTATVVGAVLDLEARAATRAPPKSTTDPQLSELFRRVQELADRTAHLPISHDEAPTADPVDALLARVGELEARLDAVASQDPIGTYPEVQESQHVRARLLTFVPAELEQAIAAWTAIAESTADPAKQAEAFFEIGKLNMKLRRSADGAAAFERVVGLVGVSDPRGQVAAQNAGLCHYATRDYPAAYQAFRRLVDAPTLMLSTAPTMRHWAAVLAARTGDVQTARRELRSYIADYDNQNYAAFKPFVEGARKLLAELE